jgi:cell wall-associated NlpC family hydrolase
MKPILVIITLSVVILSCAYHNQWRQQSAGIEGEIHPARSNRYASTDSAEKVGKNILDQFRREIRRFWKTPYVWGGTSPEGTDCSGLVTSIYRAAVGIALPHNTRLLYKEGKAVSKKNLAFGDLVFFNFKNRKSRLPDHVGIYIKDHFFLHASVSKGVSLNTLKERPYSSLFIGARRILE